MKEPRRLLDDDPEFRSLLCAVRNDGPSTAQMNKALSTAADVASSGAARAGLATFFKRWPLTVGLGVAGIAVLLGAFSDSASSMRRTNDSVASHSSTSEPLPAPTATFSQNDESSPEPTVASVRVDDLPSASPSVTTPHATGRTASPKDTFAEELALTSTARTALGRGDVAACLDAVQRYRRSFRAGVFAQEIDVTGIEALAKSGEHERARALATRFLSTNAKSPYASRVRSVLADPAN